MSTAASPTNKKIGLRSRLRRRFGALWAKRSRPSEPSVLSRRLVRCLRLTLLVDGLAAVWLALMELEIDTGLVGIFAAGLLFLVGVANLWALYSLRRERLSWPRDVAIAQALVAIVAVYVTVVAWRGDHVRAFVIAALVGIIAVQWLFRLAKDTTTVQWTKPAAFVVALFPLAGLVQFWVQTEYLPSTSLPLVDVTSDLSPMGRQGSTIRLSAKVALHNRGTVPVTIVGGLMQVITYPAAASSVPESSLKDALTSAALGSVEFRVPPLEPSSGTPNFMHTLVGATILTPGDTDTDQFEVDIDSTSVGLARLSFKAAFLTEDRIGDASTCYDPIIYRSRDTLTFLRAVSKPLGGDRGYVCTLYYLKPTSILQKLEDHPVAIRVGFYLSGGNAADLKYPFLTVDIGYVTGNTGTFQNASQRRKDLIQENYPMVFEGRIAEYAPTEPTPTPPGGPH